MTGLVAFPATPFFFLSGLLHLGLKSLEHERKAALETTEVKKEEVTQARKREPQEVTTMLQVDPIALEVGRGLLPLVDPGHGAKLLERVTSVRRHIALEMGLVVPGVRFRDNLQFGPTRLRD